MSAHRYYQSELSYLRDLGREFALRNPALAGLFSESGGDPDVDRLLEGFAFLTARIRHRAESALPEVIDALAEMVIPQYVRTLPASSIVEFMPHAAALRSKKRLAAGTEVGSRAVQGTRCLFRTTCDVDLHPLSLIEACVEHDVAARPSLRLRFQLRQAPHVVLPSLEPLRIFLKGPSGVASAIYLWLLQHLDEVSVLDANGKPVPVPPPVVKPVGLTRDHAMLPWPDHAPDGLRALLEHFTLPEKACFVDLEGLSRLEPGPHLERFDVLFRFRDPPAIPNVRDLDADFFRLHCVPVINLFAVSADPIRLDPRQNEYLLRAAGVEASHMEVYCVDEVAGLRSHRLGRRAYVPYHSFERPGADDRLACYATRRVRSPVDNGVDTYLVVEAGTDGRPDPVSETLSVELTCTNRSLPAELRVGDICEPTTRSPTMARFRNLTQVTKPCRPYMGSELHWRLVSHLALNVRSLSDVRALRGLLGLYNIQGRSDEQLGRRNQLQVDSIRSVSARPRRRVLGRVPVRGQQTCVEVNSSAFASIGDAYAFGVALEWLFASETPMNAFHELVLRLHPTGTELSYPPWLGQRPLF